MDKLKQILLLIFFIVATSIATYGEDNTLDVYDKYPAFSTPLLKNIVAPSDTVQHKKDIYALIDAYSKARETKDTVLLKSILITEVDQLVSSGIWRKGIKVAVQGMLQSSTSNPGTRTLTVENIRFLNATSAIADARYEIKNTDGSIRKMWSTFVVVYEEGRWKITAIRNMLPAQNK